MATDHLKLEAEAVARDRKGEIAVHLGHLDGAGSGDVPALSAARAGCNVQLGFR